MFLAVARACLDYFSVNGKRDHPDFVIPRLNSALLSHDPAFRRAIAVEDVETFCTARVARGARVLALTDAKEAEWASGVFIYKADTRDLPRYVEPLADGSYREYSSLPARFYITFEQEVGTVLKPNLEGCAPHLVFEFDERLNRLIRERFNFDPDVLDVLYCALIGVSGQPDEKQFGIAKFVDLARAIRSVIPEREVKFLLIVSPDRRELDEPGVAALVQSVRTDVALITIAEPNLEIIGYLLARCRFSVGNDTGLSHLASVSTKSLDAKKNPIIILYSNSDYSKWCTGGPNILPVTTSFADFLRRYNLSSAGDRVSATAWGEAATAKSISVERVLARFEQALSSVHL